MLARALCILLATLTWARAEGITVSAAISLKDSFEQIGIAYQQKTGERVDLNFGSSGQLMTQIERGAPVDVFISAASQQVDQLAEKGLIEVGTRAVIATNQLVMVVPANATVVPGKFEELADPRLRRISLGEPKSVPAGMYAMQLLKRLNLAETLEARFVFGANVRQVLNYVERGEVDAGIVYRTDAISSGEKVRLVAVADPAWHEPIEYCACVVKLSRKAEKAARFLQFLKGSEARTILAANGFSLPVPATQPAR